MAVQKAVETVTAVNARNAVRHCGEALSSDENHSSPTSIPVLPHRPGISRPREGDVVSCVLAGRHLPPAAICDDPLVQLVLIQFSPDTQPIDQDHRLPIFNLERRLGELGSGEPACPDRETLPMACRMAAETWTAVGTRRVKARRTSRVE
jgi:hypothetical protein